jgi:thiol-disulfide isomerase/thioredoxin
MQRPAWLTWGRLWDALAILVILFVAWKWFVAPRYLSPKTAFPAPHVVYPMLDGGTFALSEHRGRVVFLDFWASWCEPCKASLPLVEAFARAHPEVDVIAVNVAEPRAVAAAYAHAHNLQNVALDESASSSGYFHLDGFPTMIVIDKQGQLRAAWPGFNPAVAVNMANAEKMLR